MKKQPMEVIPHTAVIISFSLSLLNSHAASAKTVLDVGIKAKPKKVKKKDDLGALLSEGLAKAPKVGDVVASPVKLARASSHHFVVVACLVPDKDGKGGRGQEEGQSRGQEEARGRRGRGGGPCGGPVGPRAARAQHEPRQFLFRRGRGRRRGGG